MDDPIDDFKSFNRPVHAAIFGGRGGIGSALAAKLAAFPSVEKIYSLSRQTHQATHEKIEALSCDPLDEKSLKNATQHIQEHSTSLDLVIVALGVLHDEKRNVHPEKTYKAITKENFEYVLSVNTIAPSLIAKHTLPLLSKDGKSVFAALSARVGSIGDNFLGGWYSYRTSKAALNMMIRGLSIEVARKHKNAVLIGLHPGTVDTDLSAPFQGNVSEGKLFSPEYSANFLIQVIENVQAADSGQIFAWDGEKIPY